MEIITNQRQELEEFKVDRRMREEKRLQDGEITFAEYRRRLIEIGNIRD